MLRDSENNLIGIGDAVRHEKEPLQGILTETVLRGGRRTCVVTADDGTTWEAPTWLLIRVEATPSTAKAERLRALKMRHLYGKKTAR